MGASDLHAWRVERHALVDSTNRLAADRIRTCWAEDAPAAGIVITAERQHAGRGQYQRTWQSPAGGLYLSAVVENIPAEVRGLLALAAGVAVAGALLQAAGIPAQLCWPNDLLLADRKIGGILCESLAQGERWASIIGIGINVNTRMEDLPAELQARASSLLAYDGKRRDIHDMEAAVLDSLFGALQRACTDGTEWVIAQARTLDPMPGKIVEFQDGDHLYRGVARGIGDAGEFLLATGDAVRAFPTGTMVRVDGQPLRK